MLAAMAAMFTKEVGYTFPAIMATLLFFRKDQFSLKQIFTLTGLSSILLIIVLFLRNNAIESSELIF